MTVGAEELGPPGPVVWTPLTRPALRSPMLQQSCGAQRRVLFFSDEHPSVENSASFAPCADWQIMQNLWRSSAAVGRLRPAPTAAGLVHLHLGHSPPGSWTFAQLCLLLIEFPFLERIRGLKMSSGRALEFMYARAHWSSYTRALSYTARSRARASAPLIAHQPPAGSRPQSASRVAPNP